MKRKKIVKFQVTVECRLFGSIVIISIVILLLHRCNCKLSSAVSDLSFSSEVSIFSFSIGTFHLNILIENWDHIFDDIRCVKGVCWENWIQNDGDDDDDEKDDENGRKKNTQKNAFLAIDFLIIYDCHVSIYIHFNAPFDLIKPAALLLNILINLEMLIWNGFSSCISFLFLDIQM